MSTRKKLFHPSFPFGAYMLFLVWLIGSPLPLPAQTSKIIPASHSVNPVPTPRPDRIILTWQTDPANSQTVTWRTDQSVKTPLAEIAMADASPQFQHNSSRTPAKTESLRTENGEALYHSVNFSHLKPNTIYAYRVGDGTYWSEWFQFRTANTKPEPFSFIYFGDAQTNIHSLWSRTIRAAYAEAPKAKFMIHAGDLVNHPENDTEWHEWFAAGSFIMATIPSIPIPGNHEYSRNAFGIPGITKLWQPQFNLPANGLKSMQDMVYFTDYQDVRIISLNSYWFVPAQARWLEKILKDNPRKWTIVTLHYPVYSAAEGRENKNLIRHLKPLFDKYQVDLVLQGHDHSYARGNYPSANPKVQDQKTGPMYVVSVSGSKMYHQTERKWMNRRAENTQLFQIINVVDNTLIYKSMTVTGDLYDAFELQKQKDGLNRVQEFKADLSTERRFQNTLKAHQK